MKKLAYRKILKQAGDTLIEVTFALAILSMVLLGSIGVTLKAFQLGQTARERVVLSDEAQRQMEYVRGFRDNRSWPEFLNGSATGASYPGMLNAQTGGCKAISPCSHMSLTDLSASSKEYIPVAGGMTGSVLSSYIEINVEPEVATPPQYVIVTISYGFDNIGDGASNTGHIKTKLTNLKGSTAVAPPAGPPCVGGPKDIVLSLDASHSMTNPFGGSTRAGELKTVANTFINEIDISPADNHMAIDRFERTASQIIGFSSDPAVLLAAVNTYKALNIFRTEFTPAFNLASAQFAGARPGAVKVMVLVSDGAITAPDTIAAATAASDLLKANGVHIFTMGIANPPAAAVDLLQQVASSPADYSNASDTAALNSAFAAISGEVGC